MADFDAQISVLYSGNNNYALIESGNSNIFRFKVEAVKKFFLRM